ncbi:SLC13 family permease [Sulfurospirillum barnesii]|uniref:Anion transporter n=1 Tax=Sulfurospirillum barnesii (strain ATCC 700032 / DSM 10660 / SES-3) TaxID=760154 RepID=I3XZU4_SULBS|nr:DASS family sodium-coupled anion symporter [Sulfurospirillum barnesii]AFL69468.1 anion transporter [Sulfurospirillum barnesii SES-3]
MEHVEKPAVKLIAIALLLGGVGYALALLGFKPLHATMIGVLVFLVTLWTNEGLPVGVVSLLPIILFPALGLLETGATTTNYSNPIIYLFLGGFLLAIATEKTGLHKVIAKKILTVFPTTPRGVIFSLAITSGLLSSILSNTTTALLLIPIATFLSSHKILQVRFILAIAYGASIGGIITPVGTPPNMLLLGFMENHGMEMIPFVKWMMLVTPVAFVMVIFASFFLSYGLHNVGHIQEIEEEHKITHAQKRLLWMLISLIVLLFVNSPIKPYYDGLGLDERIILLSYGLIMFLPKIGVLKWEDSKKIPFDIMFLFGAGFAIAAAFSKTGLAGEIANKLMLVADFSPWLILLIVAALVTFTTEITSNTALISIMLPIIFSLSQAVGADTQLLMMAATICASYAFMLPIATPPNAIAMSTGMVSVAFMAKIGFVLNVVGILLIVFAAEFYWKFFL